MKRRARRAPISGRSAPSVRARRAHPGTHPPPSIRPRPLQIPSSRPSVGTQSPRASGTLISDGSPAPLTGSDAGLKTGRSAVARDPAQGHAPGREPSRRRLRSAPPRPCGPPCRPPPGELAGGRRSSRRSRPSARPRRPCAGIPRRTQKARPVAGVTGSDGCRSPWGSGRFWPGSGDRQVIVSLRR